MRNSNSFAVIITAAGSSTRMGGQVKKEYLPLKDGTVLSFCAKAFLDAAENPQNNITLSNLIITIPENGITQATAAMESLFKTNPKAKEIIQFVTGSSSRQSSIYNAMKQLSQITPKPEFVMIHDGARPFVSQEIISKVINATKEFGAAAPGITPTDTQKEIDDKGFITRHLVRKNLTAIQTPQSFKFDQLFEAHTKAANDSQEYTDDTEIWGKYCGAVKVVEGSNSNIKITYPGDLEKGQKVD